MLTLDWSEKRYENFSLTSSSSLMFAGPNLEYHGSTFYKKGDLIL